MFVARYWPNVLPCRGFELEYNLANNVVALPIDQRYEEIELDGIKVDYYDAKSKMIHEIKKSNKVEKAHEWQVKYYLYVFEQNGIEGVTGLLEYPVLRKTQPVILSDFDREKIEEMKENIEKIILDENCPSLVQKSLCRSCSYFEFCYSKEVEE